MSLAQELTENFIKLGFFSGEEKVNDLGNWTDDQGTIHIHVREEGSDYELINGQWVEARVF